MHSQFDGKGKYTTRMGDEYTGKFSHNCFHGDDGVMKYKDGSVYDGVWEKGHRHGFGIFNEPSGAEYCGNWRLDQRHGQGRQKMADGGIYEGTYV